MTENTYSNTYKFKYIVSINETLSEKEFTKLRRIIQHNGFKETTTEIRNIEEKNEYIRRDCVTEYINSARTKILLYYDELKFKRKKFYYVRFFLVGVPEI